MTLVAHVYYKTKRVTYTAIFALASRRKDKALKEAEYRLSKDEICGPIREASKNKKLKPRLEIR